MPYLPKALDSYSLNYVKFAFYVIEYIEIRRLLFSGARHWAVVCVPRTLRLNTFRMLLLHYCLGTIISFYKKKIRFVFIQSFIVLSRDE